MSLEETAENLKQEVAARDLEIDTLKGTFTHFTNSEATEKALRECQAALTQRSDDLHSRSQELMEARVKLNNSEVIFMFSGADVEVLWHRPTVIAWDAGILPRKSCCLCFVKFALLMQRLLVGTTAQA